LKRRKKRICRDRHRVCPRPPLQLQRIWRDRHRVCPRPPLQLPLVRRASIARPLNAPLNAPLPLPCRPRGKSVRISTLPGWEPVMNVKLPCGLVLQIPLSPVFVSLAPRTPTGLRHSRSRIVVTVGRKKAVSSKDWRLSIR